MYRWLTGQCHPDDDNAHRLAGVLRVPEWELRRRLGMWAGENGAVVSVERARYEGAVGQLEALVRHIDRELTDLRARHEETG